ncbi:MAG: winged helix-turn-helix domain-containing protein [Nitrososphaerales archaeon]
MSNWARRTRRDKLTIMAQILKNVDEPIKKTRLLYRVGMNFQELDRYLHLLIRTGMVSVIGDRTKAYKITEKGQYFLSIVDSRDIAESSVMETVLKA